MSERVCYACGATYSRKGSPGFREECENCEVPLHCCANCRFYEVDAALWCREPQARDGRPRDPLASNVCDYLIFSTSGAEPDGRLREQKAKADLAKLFGTEPAAAPPSDTPEWMKVDKPAKKDIFGKDL